MVIILNIVTIFGALGIFIYGMKVMSMGLQNLAGSQMRNIMNQLTSNRYKGVFFGFLITILVQSSSATTVMVVSFVNAGILSVFQSIGVIMGANIGTTITAWLISIFGFKFKIIVITLPLIAIGTPFLFFQQDKYRYLGETIIGFSLLFIGLDTLKNTMPNLEENIEIFSILKEYTQMGFFSTIIFVFIGTGLTILVQSSSAAMAFTLVMCNNGWIPLDAAAAIVLGENIGTTITANIASIVGNIHAKRAAVAHLIFNLFGVFWILLIFPFFLDFIDWIIQSYYGVSSFEVENYALIPIALSLFHTLFNIINTILLVGFISYIVKIVSKLVKAKDEEDQIYYLEFTSKGIFQTPSISIIEARKEMIKFGSLILKIQSSLKKTVSESKKKVKLKNLKEIRRRSDISKKIEYEITEFLFRLAQSNISSSVSFKIQSILKIINHLKNISILFSQIGENLFKEFQNNNLKEKQKKSLSNFLLLLEESLGIMFANLSVDNEKIVIEQAQNKKQKINTYRNEITREYLNDIVKSGHKKESMVYIEIVNQMGNVSDSIFSVSETIAENG